MMKKNLSVAVACGALLLSADPGTEFENAPKLEHECTSWMVFSDLTKNNTNILHKNRDSKARKVVAFLSDASSPRKYIALGTPGFANMGINTSGLAGVMNSGEICIDQPDADKSKKSTPQIMTAVLESCDTAAQAVEKLKEFIKAGDYWHGPKGSIFFFMDRNEGYICETTAKYVSVQRYDHGYAVRANIWQNPGMYQFSRSTIKYHLNCSARAFIAISGLNQMLEKDGKITPSGIFDLSRHWKMPEESPEKRSVCFANTNSTASLELDRQYPDVLSSGYFTIGHPRHTVYVPVPICAKKLHPAMGNDAWAEMTWERYKKEGLCAEFPAEWAKFEQEFMAKYAKAKEEARKLLNAGKRGEAIELMNTVAAEIWNGAVKLLGL